MVLIILIDQYSKILKEKFYGSTDKLFNHNVDVTEVLKNS